MTAAASGTDSEHETNAYASESTTEQTSFGLTYTTYTPDSTGTSGPISTSGPTSATSQSATEVTSTTDSTDAPVNFSTDVNAEPIPASEQAEDDFRNWLRSYDDYMKLFLSFATPGITVTTTSGTTNKGNQNYLTSNKCQKFGKLLH